MHINFTRLKNGRKRIPPPLSRREIATTIHRPRKSLQSVLGMVNQMSPERIQLLISGSKNLTYSDYLLDEFKKFTKDNHNPHWQHEWDAWTDYLLKLKSAS